MGPVWPGGVVLAGVLAALALLAVCVPLRRRIQDARAELQTARGAEKKARGEAKKADDELARRRGELDEMGRQLAGAREEAERLDADARRYYQVRDKLANSTVVRTFVQPVLLLGPRSVGKTSLMNQLNAPWSYEGTTATTRYRTTFVPFYDRESYRMEPHFADENVRVGVTAHLRLKVFDFPGEVSTQAEILTAAEHETRALRDSLGNDLGIVLVLMFDASEAFTGIKPETTSYFTSEFFGELGGLVTVRQVSIERVIIVFNKLDLAKNYRPGATDDEVVKACLQEFGTLLAPLSRVVNGDRICEVITVMNQESRLSKRGASVVRGEAAVGLVKAVVGGAEIGRIVPERASTGVAAQWPGMI